MEQRNETIVRKMLLYCEDIENTNTLFSDNKELFFHDKQGRVYRNAVSMPILQIGELAKHLSDDFIAEHSLIPWKQIIRMRDLFAHHYGSTDYMALWDTAHDDIGKLKSFLLSIAT